MTGVVPTVVLAVVVAVVVGAAAAPWRAGARARLSAVSGRLAVTGRPAVPGRAHAAGRARVGGGVSAPAVDDGPVPADRRGAGAPAGSAGGDAQVPDVDVVLVLDLVQVAVASGAALPRALQAVGGAVGGADGDVLVRVARSLVLGAGWATAWSGVDPRFAVLPACLADAWESGSAPGPALRAAAEQVARGRRRAAREAAGRLGVRLVLPLGLCFLPAFVLLGLVPVLISLAGGLLG